MQQVFKLWMFFLCHNIVTPSLTGHHSLIYGRLPVININLALVACHVLGAFSGARISGRVLVWFVLVLLRKLLPTRKILASPSTGRWTSWRRLTRALPTPLLPTRLSLMKPTTLTGMGRFSLKTGRCLLALLARIRDRREVVAWLHARGGN